MSDQELRGIVIILAVIGTVAVLGVAVVVRGLLELRRIRKETR